MGSGQHDCWVMLNTVNRLSGYRLNFLNQTVTDKTILVMVNYFTQPLAVLTEVIRNLQYFFYNKCVNWFEQMGFNMTNCKY
jgi:hypothetical protein